MSNYPHIMVTWDKPNYTPNQLKKLILSDSWELIAAGVVLSADSLSASSWQSITTRRRPPSFCLLQIGLLSLSQVCCSFESEHTINIYTELSSHCLNWNDTPSSGEYFACSFVYCTHNRRGKCKNINCRGSKVRLYIKVQYFLSCPSCPRR